MTITLQPNTIRHRGLPTIVREHIGMRWAIADLTNIGAVEVFRGAHCEALDTVVWFLYGERPINQDYGRA